MSAPTAVRFPPYAKLLADLVGAVRDLEDARSFRQLGAHDQAATMERVVCCACRAVVSELDPPREPKP